MKQKDLQLWDWHRILIGNVPLSFFVEAVFRLAFVYLLLLVAMRLLGKRMAAQLDRIEMASMVTLAAAIGVPLQSPERGLLPSVVIALVVIAIGKTTALLAVRNEVFQQATHGDIASFIEDGVLQLHQLKETTMPEAQVKAWLRTRGIKQLGEVERLYFEANGLFTLIRKDPANPGLPILPDWDADFVNEMTEVGQEVCSVCGLIQPLTCADGIACVNCGNSGRRRAVV